MRSPLQAFTWESRRARGENRESSASPASAAGPMSPGPDCLYTDRSSRLGHSCSNEGVEMRYRPISVFIFFGLLTAALPSFAGEKHLLLGTWNVDVSKLNTPNPPASVTMVLAEAGDGSYRMTVDIVTRDGKTIHAGSPFKPDGSLFAVSGSDELDVATFAMPNRKSLVMGTALAGQSAPYPRLDAVRRRKLHDGNHRRPHRWKTPHIRTATWKRAKRD